MFSFPPLGTPTAQNVFIWFLVPTSRSIQLRIKDTWELVQIHSRTTLPTYQHHEVHISTSGSRFRQHLPNQMQWSTLNGAQRSIQDQDIGLRCESKELVNKQATFRGSKTHNQDHVESERPESWKTKAQGQKMMMIRQKENSGNV